MTGAPVAAALGALVVLSSCGGPAPSATAAPVVVITPGADAAVVHLGGRTHAVLDLQTGATTLSVLTVRQPDTLLLVSAGAGSGLAPRVTTSGDTVLVRADNVGNATAVPSLSVAIDPDVSWSIRLTGGAASLAVDLGAAHVDHLEILGGAADMRVALPPPHGTAELVLRGGATDLAIHTGAAPVRIRLGVGTGALTVLGDARGEAGPSTTVTGDGFDQASDRWDVDVEAGTSTINVAH